MAGAEQRYTYTAQRIEYHAAIINLYYLARTPSPLLFTLFPFHSLYWSHFYFGHIHDAHKPTLLRVLYVFDFVHSD